MRALQLARNGAIALTVFSLGACSSAGALGDILGGVLGGGQQAQSSQVAGTIRGVDRNNQQIQLQQSNGQTVALLFDNNTRVIYQNQNYAVTSLENGDQVTAKVQQTQQGGYYTDTLFVTQSVSTGGGGTSGGSVENVQSLQGSVRAIDRNQGLFSIDAGNGTTLTVSLPYKISTADANKFQNLRTGDYVRLYGVYLNNTRVELRQFY